MEGADEAALKIQSLARGKRDRERVKGIREQRMSGSAAAGEPEAEVAGVPAEAEAPPAEAEAPPAEAEAPVEAGTAAAAGEEEVLPESYSEDQQQAVVKIQSVARGNRDRERVKGIKNAGDATAGGETAAASNDVAEASGTVEAASEEEDRVTVKLEPRPVRVGGYFTASQVAMHNTPRDCWVSFLGKVVNVTSVVQGADCKGPWRGGC